MKIVKQNCIEVTKDSVTLKDGTKIPCGLVVWTAGVGPNDLTKSITVFDKSKRAQHPDQRVLPGARRARGRAAGAVRHAVALERVLDRRLRRDRWLRVASDRAESAIAGQLPHVAAARQRPALPYRFHNKGMMAYLGSYEGLFELKKPRDDGSALAKLHGWKAWFLWRSAYLTKLGSWRLRLQVPLGLAQGMVVGRDVSRF
ncbi:hypothetical protein PINS_up018239 [Pythium insidiosum]|nr:hypothetical protein PINS_up018239 [Pythium insidiosum]